MTAALPLPVEDGVDADPVSLPESSLPEEVPLEEGVPEGLLPELLEVVALLPELLEPEDPPFLALPCKGTSN